VNDPSSTTTTELFHVVQRDDEPLEKYMFRIQKLANDAFLPSSAADMRNYVSVFSWSKRKGISSHSEYPSILEQA
jgi:hypothetical protein